MNDERRADYQMAGELFGLIEAGLGFGYLSMHKTNEEFAFVYTWMFSANTVPYETRRVIDIRRERINERMPLEELARRIVHEWKIHFRHASSVERLPL